MIFECFKISTATLRTDFFEAETTTALYLKLTSILLIPSFKIFYLTRRDWCSPFSRTWKSTITTGYKINIF